LVDLDGVRLAQALRDAGRDPGRLGAARLDPAAYAAFVELHIEQGPVLEEAQVPLGVVDVIAGSALAQVSVEGVTAHAGAMPMRLRRDALAAASQMVLAVEEETRRAVGGNATGTVGSLRPHPGASNVIAGKVDFDIDLRDGDQRIKAQLAARVRERVEAIAGERGVQVHWEQRTDDPPTPTDPRVRALLVDTSRDHGEALEMPSGPFHDAAQIASIMPMGMIFVPSRGGLSHCPEEWTDLDQCVTGVTVLANALQRLSE
jgi:allantoate deiminase